jgi:hypothetical protein
MLKNFISLIFILIFLNLSGAGFAESEAFKLDFQPDKMGALYTYLYNLSYIYQAKTKGLAPPDDVRFCYWQEYLKVSGAQNILEDSNKQLSEFFELETKYKGKIRQALVGEKENKLLAWIAAGSLGIAKVDINKLIEIVNHFEKYYGAAWEEQVQQIAGLTQTLLGLSKDEALQPRLLQTLKFFDYNDPKPVAISIAVVPCPEGFFISSRDGKIVLEISPAAKAEDILPSLWLNVFNLLDPHYPSNLAEKYLINKLKMEDPPLKIKQNFIDIFQVGLLSALTEVVMGKENYISGSTPADADLHLKRAEVAAVFAPALKKFFDSDFKYSDSPGDPYKSYMPVDYFLFSDQYLSAEQKIKVEQIAGITSAPQLDKVCAWEKGELNLSYANGWEGPEPEALQKLNWAILGNGVYKIEECTKMFKSNQDVLYRYIDSKLAAELNIGNEASPNYFNFNYFKEFSHLWQSEVSKGEPVKFDFFAGVGVDGNFQRKDLKGEIQPGITFANARAGLHLRKPLTILKTKDKDPLLLLEISPYYDYGKSLTNKVDNRSRAYLQTALYNGKPYGRFSWGCRYNASAPTQNMRKIVGDAYFFLRYQQSEAQPALELGYLTGYYPDRYDTLMKTLKLGLTWIWK